MIENTHMNEYLHLEHVLSISTISSSHPLLPKLDLNVIQQVSDQLPCHLKLDHFGYGRVLDSPFRKLTTSVSCKSCNRCIHVRTWSSRFKVACERPASKEPPVGDDFLLKSMNQEMKLLMQNVFKIAVDIHTRRFTSRYFKKLQRLASERASRSCLYTHSTDAANFGVMLLFVLR